MSETIDNKIREIAETLRANNPDLKLYRILVPGREDEIFIARKAPWSEYKKLVGAVKDEAAANELLVQKFLMHPKPDFEAMQSEWDPGLVVTLAQQIQKGLGFVQGASIKNV